MTSAESNPSRPSPAPLRGPGLLSEGQERFVGPSLRVRFLTFGCRVNQYESEMMQRTLASHGARLVEGSADAYVLNACTVTRLAEKKARQAAHRARLASPGAPIILVGCLAEAVQRGWVRFDEADLVAGNAWKARIDEVVAAALRGRRGLLPLLDPLPLDVERSDGTRDRVRAYVKVQDGCSHACTYCRPSAVRGPSRCKSIAAAAEEAARLVEVGGFPELVLTGVNLAEYVDEDGRRLPDLIERLLPLQTLFRLRLASLNLGGLTEPLLKLFRRDGRLCRHFHIPAQSGDDGVLASMGRGYDVQAYRARVERVRNVLPDATFGTDLMVGFPGEDDAAFARTCRLVEDVGFVNLHLFRYSPRPGTPAATYADPVPERVRRQRAQRLLATWRSALRPLLDARVGTVEDVLIEGRQSGRFRGYTSDYLHVAFASESRRPVGTVCPVRITAVSEDGLEGVSEDRDDPD